MPSKDIRIKGTRELVQAFKRIGKRARTVLAGAVFQEAEIIMAEAKRQTPVDTGALRSTGHVALPNLQGNKIAVKLGFGGPAGSQGVSSPGRTGREAPKTVGYGVRVHEDLEAQHPTGKAKFLEEPLLKAAKGYAGRLSKRLRGKLK